MLPLAKYHGYTCVWTTINPDNIASRITIERIGGTLVDVVDIPLNNPARHDGSTQKCRYRIDL
jgi:predicted acetyltransferase